ncbi:MAG: NAD-dependent epimerase/dehydratase family protein, partial [Gammaproteobacteria bacterium]|nr:NAD-dependent epimerase/dehydratase family protein [Gammaproteobacteria bacterium]
EYGMNKILCEQYLVEEHRRTGFPATMVPFSMVFGPNNIIPDREQRMFVRLKAARPALIGGDGTTLSQVGHVDDQARALRMMMLNPITYGKRYNLTGKDYWSDEGYVDTFASVMGVEANKVFVPAKIMDEIWQDRPATRFMIQSVAPNIHAWNDSALFSIDRLRNDIGWEPEYTFASAVAQTYAWFLSEGLDKTREFDFSFEDALLERIRGI